MYVHSCLSEAVEANSQELILSSHLEEFFLMIFASTQHTANSTLRTPGSALHTAASTLHIAVSTLNTAGSALHTADS